MKTITVEEYIQAIEKNGLPQTFYQYYRFDAGKIGAACAMGQAHLNLGLYNAEKQNKFWTYEHSVASEIESRTIELNDNAKLSFAAIGKALREEYSDYLHETMYKLKD